MQFLCHSGRCHHALYILYKPTFVPYGNERRKSGGESWIMAPPLMVPRCLWPCRAVSPHATLILHNLGDTCCNVYGGASCFFSLDDGSTTAYTTNPNSVRICTEWWLGWCRQTRFGRIKGYVSHGLTFTSYLVFQRYLNWQFCLCGFGHLLTHTKID